MSVGLQSGYYGAGTQDLYNGAGAGTRTFVPEIWSGKLQVKFYAATVLGEITNND